jgi:hypothetical protein
MIIVFPSDVLIVLPTGSFWGLLMLTGLFGRIFRAFLDPKMIKQIEILNNNIL